jgi:hypothetical protein
MPRANPHGKPHLEMIKRQRAIMEYVKAAIGQLAHVVMEIEEEGIRLNYLAAEFDRATLRGETPDPSAVAQLAADKAAFFQREEKLTAHMQALGQQAEAVTSMAEAVSFDILVRQFITQFNIKEDL